MHSCEVAAGPAWVLMFWLCSSSFWRCLRFPGCGCDECNSGLSMIGNIMERIFGSRLIALIVKETREILRNRYLMFLLHVTPIVQLVILAAALDPQVRSLRLGIVDHASTSDSREF